MNLKKNVRLNLLIIDILLSCARDELNQTGGHLNE
jgi:hypothetical protein